MHISSATLPRVAVVIGSNRPERICPEIAVWVQQALRANELLEVDLVDLQVLDLPFLDEPIMASRGRYEHEHTVRWSEIVRSYCSRTTATSTTSTRPSPTTFPRSQRSPPNSTT